MRFEVPQFIEVEDKIIGPFTWKQFIYLAGGTGIILIAFFSLPFLLFVLVAVPAAALAGSLAFHKINNRPFSVFLESFFSYMSSARLYLWRKETQQTIEAKQEGPAAMPMAAAQTGEAGNIASLSRKLELNNTLNTPEPTEKE